MRYRVVKGWKYQLLDDYSIIVGITPHSPIITPYLLLDSYGRLTIRKGYAWDGPSGPTFDTRDFMRGSLVHDALYQLMRMGLLNIVFRPITDMILKNICLQDGMCCFRAWYVYWAVRLFASSSAKPGTEKPLKIVEIKE